VTLEGVIFDFDGVIANSEPLHLRVYQILLGQEGLALSAAEYYERYLGFDDVGVFQRMSHDKGLRIDGARMDDLIARKTALFQGLTADDHVLFPGAAACVRAAAAAVPIGIASGALRHEIEQILDGAGLRSLVPVIVAAGETPRGKPAPDPYSRALASMSERAGRRLDPAGVVAIEDSAWGLQSARAAGLRTLGVSTSYPADALHHAELVVEHIGQVTIALLDGLVARPRRAERGAEAQ
jgi:beta-phosphoglucomutase